MKGDAIMKQMRCKGYTITERKDGAFKIKYVSTLGTYETVCKNFFDAAEWVWNMADNHDIGNHVNHKMCDVWNRVIWEDSAYIW